MKIMHWQNIPSLHQNVSIQPLAKVSDGQVYRIHDTAIVQEKET